LLFNSIDFAIFLPIVFLLYWFVFKNNTKHQNILLLLASYVFYGWWDYRFLSLIVISSVVDFIVGHHLDTTETKVKRKLLLLVSIAINLGFLGFFKYYNFFAENFIQSFSLFGYKPTIETLTIVLPVGISFYTFQTLSYSIDIYRKKMKSTKDVIAFFAFVSFFPQLVAGPIERACNLLPQFKQRKLFNYKFATDGIRQIIWGLFKKVVIADSCAVYVNDIFANYSNYSGSTLMMGGILFAFQIYADFSGYSDIAIGTARLFGFNLMKNFAFPYFSRDIAEFWRRWHISLSTWFRDYVYIPLGGSRGNNITKLRNILIIFIVSGFWHGANWTFVIWGFLNALYFLPLLFSKLNRKNIDTVAQNRLFPTIKEIMQISVTFFLTVIAWIFFRADNAEMAFLYLFKMFSVNFISIPEVLPVILIGLIIILLVVEWFQRERNHGLEFEGYNIPFLLRYSICYSVIILVLLHLGNKQEFIYFQF